MLDLRILSLIVISSSAIALVALERLFPYDPRQRFLREQFFNDLLLYTIVQSYLLGVGIASLIGWLDSANGVARLHIVSSWGIGWQFVFFLVLHDLYIYWFHRWQHHSAYLWRIHEAHHSTHHVDWLSGSRSHALEILINQTIEFGVIALLGGAPEVAIWKATIDAVWGMYIHSNLNVRSGWLQRIINGPEMHRWHHATDADAHNCNFSTKIAAWDWLFGTAFLPAERKPHGYGLGDIHFPSTYIKQLVFAFRREHLS